MAMESERSNVDNDGLRSYFDQIKRTALLSFEEELELSRRIQKGDEAARQRLIEANLRLVVRIAKSFKTPDVSLLDLIQEGNLGLIKAAAKYDHRKQVRFSTYASWWIKQSIVRSLSNKRRVIRLPHRKEEKLRKINKAYNALAQHYQRTPTMSEIADEIGMKEKDIESILALTTNVVSLSSSPGTDNGTLQELIEDTTYEPERELISNSLREETRRFLETLLEKEKQILMYRFAFYGGKKYTLKRIGDELGISPETVRQIEIRALKKLRKCADSLKEYVYS
jgi:RNA polymerase primary sigma factor